MSLRRRFRSAAILLIAVGCERAKSPPPADSGTIRPAGRTDSVPNATATTWNSTAGPVLLVAGDEPSHAFIVVPDSNSAAATLEAIPHPANVMLYSRGGTVQAAQLPEVSETGVCAAATLTAAPPPRPWSVGFIGGVVSPLPVDSLESISVADSARLTVWMNRLASALPNDSAGRFVGLPFVLRSLWRFKLPNGAPVVLAALARQINQEATPLQENTFLITEESPADSSYALAYSERHYGAEETIQNTEVLASALVGPSRTPTIIVVRDFGDSNSYGLIERASDGTWRARWSSNRRHC
jgi:hypothetical protein